MSKQAKEWNDLPYWDVCKCEKCGGKFKMIKDGKNETYPEVQCENCGDGKVIMDLLEVMKKEYLENVK